jgi:predicted nucleic acid-binding protein
MVVIDTNVYIYFLEKNPKYFSAAEKVIKRALEDGPICVPTITLMEILSGTSEEEIVLDFFLSSPFVLEDFTAQTAIEAGKLRYKNKSLKSADAILLATGIVNNASHFITNDEHLEKLQLGIKIIPINSYQ